MNRILFQIVINMCFIGAVSALIGWLNKRKAVQPQIFSQPVVQGATGSNPVENMRIFLRTADHNARRFKHRHIFFSLFSIISGTIITIAVGEVDPRVIKVLSGLATVIGGIASFLKSQEAWMSARKLAHELADEVLMADMGLSTDQTAQAKRLIQALGGDSSRFREIAAKLVVPPSTQK